MFKTSLFFVLSLSVLLAQEPGTTPPAHGSPTRTTLTPSEYLRLKEKEYRKQDAELKKHESALEFWQSELDKAKNSETQAKINRGISLVSIPVSYYLGGKLLKVAAPATPAKRFFSLDYAKQFVATHPKLSAGTFWTVTIGPAVGVAAENTYYLWALSPKEIEELSAKVAKSKEDVAKAREKLNKALSDLGGRKPDTTPNANDQPDPLDE